jgi:hypothetical protein
MNCVIWCKATGDYFIDVDYATGDEWCWRPKYKVYKEGTAYMLMGALQHEHGQAGMLYVKVISLEEAQIREVMDS